MAVDLDPLGREPWDPQYDQPAATLLNGEFEFRGKTFGTLRSGYPLSPGGFVISSPEYRTQDTDNSQFDGITFGRDYLGAPTYSFSVEVFHEGPTRWEDAASAVGELQRVWRAPYTRANPTEVDSLRIYHGARPVRVFGRARNFEVSRPRIRKGWATVSFDFRAMDDLVYSDQQQVKDMGRVPPAFGGLLAPLVDPLSTARYGTRAGFIDVGGERATPLQVTFIGPITNPKVEIYGQWEIGLNMTLREGQRVTVNPLERTVSDGSASYAGALTRSTPPLMEMRLLPGHHELVFSGKDTTNTARCVVSWYDAWYTI